MNLQKHIPSTSKVLMGLGVLAGATLFGKGVSAVMNKSSAPAPVQSSAYRMPVKSMAFDDDLVRVD